MSTYNVNLKKIVDDSYEIEIGFHLVDKLVEDLKTDLLKGISKFAVITDSNVKNLYAKTIFKKLIEAGYQAD
jgi:3-dehydroquinate synthase